MESWNSTLKSELGERFESYWIAKERLFDYIEVFYNQQRRHSSLGYKSPAQYERSTRLALQSSSNTLSVYGSRASPPTSPARC